jgi:isopenicillin N synthase-like dioxygenase
MILMLMTVPVIDIAPYFSDDPSAKLAVAKQIDQACRDIGFLVITGHGVSHSLIDHVYGVSREFFDLPISEKMKCRRPAPDQVRGYARLGSEAAQYGLGAESPPDLNESLSIGPIDVDRGDPYYTCRQAGPHFAPNVWPENPPGLRDAWTEWFHVMEVLARDLMRLFALALDLPERFFDDKIDRHISMFRVLNYPDQGEAPLPNQYRSGAHSDYGSLTILRIEDRPGGLQVCNKAGEWVAVPCVPDSFVVNIADLMMQWTNDRWISTMHRVANPPRDKALDSRRMSLVFFHQPNYDTVVECLPSCLEHTERPNYAPITSGDHLLSKFIRQTTFSQVTLDEAKASTLAIPDHTTS